MNVRDRQHGGELDAEPARREPLPDEAQPRRYEHPNRPQHAPPERPQHRRERTEQRTLALTLEPGGEAGALLRVAQAAARVDDGDDHRHDRAEDQRRLPDDLRDARERAVGHVADHA
jgi:hypothetical protein